MVEMITQAMRGEMQQMKSGIDENAQQMKEEIKNKMETSTCEIKTNACRMSNKMDANMQAFRSDMRALRGETRNMGQCLQAGIMAAPRAGANELRGSVDCVGLAGEDKLIRGTCWARSVEVTEKVTVTEREKLNGVTETCTRHIETREVMNEVTELAETRRETQELKETRSKFVELMSPAS